MNQVYIKHTKLSFYPISNTLDFQSVVIAVYLEIYTNHTSALCRHGTEPFVVW